MHDERLFATSVAAGNGTVFERVIDYLVILQNIKRIKASFAINRYADSLGTASDLCGSAWNELRLGDRGAGIFGAVLNWLVVGNTSTTELLRILLTHSTAIETFITEPDTSLLTISKPRP